MIPRLIGKDKMRRLAVGNVSPDDQHEGDEQFLIDEAFATTIDSDDQPRVGLALTRAIVKQYGGSFEIDSEPGGGTYI